MFSVVKVMDYFQLSTLFLLASFSWVSWKTVSASGKFLFSQFFSFYTETLTIHYWKPPNILLIFLARNTGYHRKKFLARAGVLFRNVIVSTKTVVQQF